MACRDRGHFLSFNCVKQTETTQNHASALLDYSVQLLRTAPQSMELVPCRSFTSCKPHIPVNQFKNQGWHFRGLHPLLGRSKAQDIDRKHQINKIVSKRTVWPPSPQLIPQPRSNRPTLPLLKQASKPHLWISRRKIDKEHAWKRETVPPGQKIVTILIRSVTVRRWRPLIGGINSSSRREKDIRLLPSKTAGCLGAHDLPSRNSYELRF